MCGAASRGIERQRQPGPPRRRLVDQQRLSLGCMAAARTQPTLEFSEQLNEADLLGMASQV